MKDAARRDYVWNKGYDLKPKQSKKAVYNKIAEVSPSIGEFYPEPVDQIAAAHYAKFIKQSEFDKPYANEGYPLQEYGWDNPGTSPWKGSEYEAADAPDPVDTAIGEFGGGGIFDVETEDKFCPGEIKELTFNMTEPYTGFDVTWKHTGTTVTFVKQNTDNQVVLEIDADIDQRDWITIVFYMRTFEGVTGFSSINVSRLACGHYVLVKMGDYCTVYDAKNDKVADDVIDNAGTGLVVFPADFTDVTNWLTNYALDNSSGYIWSENPIDDGVSLKYWTRFPCGGQDLCDKGISATTSTVGYYSQNAFFDEDCTGVCVVADPTIPICPPPAAGPAPNLCCASPMVNQYDVAPCSYGGLWPINTASTPLSVMSEDDCGGGVLTNDFNLDYMYYYSVTLVTPNPLALNCPEYSLPFDYSINPHGCGKGTGNGWAFEREQNTVYADGVGGTFWSKDLTCNFPTLSNVKSNLRRETVIDNDYTSVQIGGYAPGSHSEEWITMDQTMKLKSPLGEVVSLVASTNMYDYFSPNCDNVFQIAPDAFPASYEVSTATGFNRKNYANDIAGSHWEGAVNAYSEKTQVQIYAARFKTYTMTTGGNISPPANCFSPVFGSSGCIYILDNGCLNQGQDWENVARYAGYRTETGYASGLIAQCEYFPEAGADKQSPCSASTNATFESGIDDLIDYYYSQEGLGVNDVPDKDDNFEIALMTFSKRA